MYVYLLRNPKNLVLCFLNIQLANQTCLSALNCRIYIFHHNKDGTKDLSILDK